MRAAILGDGDEAELAIIVRTDDKNHGLGWALMQKLLTFARDLGLESRHSPQNGVTHIWKKLLP